MAIFHLSIPVTDLDESIDFYQKTLRGRLGRREKAWADIALFGAQLTLQWAPADVPSTMPRTRHFGATLHWAEWLDFVASTETFVEAPEIRFTGTDREQAKCLIADPSGNLIELKSYRNPAAVLGDLAAGTEA